MPEQFLLPGFFPDSRPADNLLLVVLATQASGSLTRLAQYLREKHGLLGRPLKPNHFHISLYSFGNPEHAPVNLFEKLNEAIATAALPSFEVTFDRVMTFDSDPSDRPFVLCGSSGIAALKTFHQNLGVALLKHGLGRYVRNRAFVPHVTLLYDKDCVAEHPVEPVSWTVREFALVHSWVGDTRYDILARWPLRG